MDDNKDDSHNRKHKRKNKGIIKKEVEFHENPKELLGSPDLSTLVYLEMKNVLINCEYRYSTTDLHGKPKPKFCYTSISTILLAINPYESLPIYGKDVIDMFEHAAKKGRLLSRPHPYGVSARSYMRMIQRRSNQSVIVCGESGAGKTETTKLLMRYLAMTAPTVTMESSIVEQQIIAASPILEAYGNAKTVMNNNSSRFGKFTKLLYNVPAKARQGHILGSYLETYLLEKSRVVFQANNERNYHIHYFLYAGLTDHINRQVDISQTAQVLADEYGMLHDCSGYKYTNQGNCITVPGLSDVWRYNELVSSMEKMRIDSEMQKELWQLTSGVLNLGNIQFKQSSDGYAMVDIKCNKYLNVISKLWGIPTKKLVDRLTTASLKLPKSKSKKNCIIKKLSVDDAVINRDSIAKGIYENIFLWLCSRINAELYDVSAPDNDENSIFFIGILDVFGFENFWINSLEQFCINFTNEKLQQYFNYHIIRSEQEEYIKEGVFWKPLTIPDNMTYMKMVEHRQNGFFTLLDSACKAPQPSAEAFIQELFKNHNKNAVLSRATKPGSGNARGKPDKKTRRQNKNKRYNGFCVSHFADLVSYDVMFFLNKNMEAVHPDTAKMMSQSKKQLVKYIGGTQNLVSGNASKRTHRKRSVTAVFWSGIKTLMKNLDQTEPYFVRCVNPNQQRSNKIWNENYVKHQLKCGGLVEALKVLKLGYPTRVEYKLLYERYHNHVQNPLIKTLNAEAFSTALLIAFDVDEQDYELGLTKIFFKPAKAAILDTIMARAGQPLSEAQNKKITKYIVQKRIKQLIGSAKSFLMMRRRVRLARAQKNFRYAGRVAGILGGSVYRHLQFARDQIRERKRTEAAILMQTFFRGRQARTKHVTTLAAVKEAQRTIWTAFKAYRQREGLRKFLDEKVAAKRILKKKLAQEARELAAKHARDLALKQAREAVQAKAEQDRLVAEAAATALREKLLKEKLEREQERERQEKLRAEAEAAKAKAEAKAEAERKRQQEEKELAETKADEPDDRDEDELLEVEIERKKKQQESVTRKMKRERKQKKLKEHEQRRRSRKQKAKDNERRRLRDEDQLYRKRKSKRFTDPDDTEIENDSYFTEYSTDHMFNSSDESPAFDVDEQLKDFVSIAKFGQLFCKHSGKKHRKPQERIVKIAFNSQSKPTEISWGTGTRHIAWEDILYVQAGLYTPAFELRKQILDKDYCLSVVAKNSILDLQAHTKEVRQLWVKGIRKLLGHNDASKQQAKAKRMFGAGNLPGMEIMNDSNAKNAERKRDVQKLMRLQEDLFIMTTHTVFRLLEEERIWELSDAVKREFDPKKQYPNALKEDVPWREWNNWIREKITGYCIRHGLVIRLLDNNANMGSMPFHVAHNQNAGYGNRSVSNMQPLVPIAEQYVPQQYIPQQTQQYASQNMYRNYPFMNPKSKPTQNYAHAKTNVQLDPNRNHFKYTNLNPATTPNNNALGFSNMNTNTNMNMGMNLHGNVGNTGMNSMTSNNQQAQGQEACKLM